MKKYFSVLIALLLPLVLQASKRTMNMTDAIKGHFVKMTAVNFKGGFTGTSVRLSVANLKKDSLDLTVDLGIILKPEDSSYQPMVLAGEENLVLEPNQKGSVDVEVFCGNSPLHCPKKDLRYTYWKKGSSELISVLTYIHNHRLYDYLGQSAVWTITNMHNAGAVYDQSRDSLSKKLIDTICAVTHRAKPDYYTITVQNEVPGQTAYTAKTMKIVAQFDVLLKGSAILTLGVFDEREHMIEAIFERKRFEKGMHQVEANFNAEAYGAGKFKIRLMDSERVLQEKKVVAEE